MTRQLFWFGVVGVTAMLVHLGSVALVLVPLGLTPLIANMIAFCWLFKSVMLVIDILLFVIKILWCRARVADFFGCFDELCCQ